MSLFRFSLRNAWRVPLRTLLTIFAVAITLVAFLLLRTINASWNERIRQTPNNRVVTRHKVGFEQSMPIHYAEQVRRLPGVKRAMGGRFLFLKNPAKETRFFESNAVEAKPFVEMHYELVAPPEQKQAFIDDRRGMLVSRELADEFGWKLGQTVHLQGVSIPGKITLHVSGIFVSSRHGFAQRALWLHWQYLNELLPADDRDKISIISAEIYNPSQGADMAKAVDLHFDDQDNQTFTQQDQALNASLVGMFGAIWAALDLVSVLILAIVALILGNTIAMSVRERTQEFGVLKALGFLPKGIAALVLGEALATGVLGGLVGVLLAYPLIQRPLSRYFEESMDFLPLRIPSEAAAVAVLLGGALGVAAAALPALRAAKLEVVTALRHID